METPKKEHGGLHVRASVRYRGEREKRERERDGPRFGSNGSTFVQVSRTKRATHRSILAARSRASVSLFYVYQNIHLIMPHISPCILR